MSLNGLCQKKQKKHAIENLFLLFIVIAREHVGTQSMQGTLAGEHAKHARHVGTLSRKHVCAQGTLAREHVACKHIRHFGM